MPLRARLTLATVLMTALVFGISGWLFLGSFERGLRDSVDEGLRGQSRAFVGQLEQRGGELSLRDERASVVPTGEVVAQVLDADGGVIDSTREAGVAPVLTSGEAERALRGRLFADAVAADEDEPFRVLAAPLELDGRSFVAVIGSSLEATEESVDRVQRALVIGGIAAVALTGVGAWFLAAAALRPVERMRQRAAEISADDPRARLDVPRGRDELAALGATMNALLDRMQAALEQQRSLVGDAGHELRTPLAVLHAELELAGRPGRSPEELCEAIARASDEVDRIVDLTDELLFLARDDAGQLRARREATDARAVVDAAVARHSDAAARRGVRIDTACPPNLPASLDADLVARALDNLMTNALRYAPHGSAITLQAEPRPGAIRFGVADDGPGFPPEFLAHAFERFRRADDARARADGGTGLGLAIVRVVAESHGGTARAANRPGGGAEVSMELPIV